VALAALIRRRKKSSSISVTHVADIAIMRVVQWLTANQFALNANQASDRWIVILFYV